MNEYPRHPEGAKYRDLTEHEYRDLREAIKAHGLIDEIKLLDGQVLDGWHRLLACTDEGVEPRFRELPPDTDPADFAYAANAARRQLSKEERNSMMVEMHKEGRSTRQIAEAVGVDQKTVCNVMKSVEEYSSPESIKGKDGKTYKTKKEPAQAEPKEPMKGWMDVLYMRRNVAIPTSMRYPNSLSLKAEYKAKIEEILGRPIPKRVEPNGSDIEEVEKAIIAVVAAEHPETMEAIKAAANSTYEVLPEKDKAKLDKAIAKHIEFIDIEARAQADKRVGELRAHLRAEIAKQDALLAEAKAARDSAIRADLTVDRLLTYDQFRLIRSCLHPDRQPEDMRDKYNRAFDIFSKLEEKIRPQTSLAMLREMGWEHKSPYYRKDN